MKEVFLGVIPARGGSKGLPLKNIQNVLGRPLIAYTIEAAGQAVGLDAFLVSTDSEEIEGVSRAEGGWVPFLRPAHLASDASPTWEALQHAVRFYEGAKGARVHSVVTLQPTTPLRRAEDITEALDLYRSKQPEADCLISVCEAEHMHPLTLYREERPWIRPFLPGANHTKRRQDWDRIMWRNGAIYISRRELVMEQNRVVGERPLYYEMPVSRSVSIDTAYDLKLAELHLEHRDWLEDRS